MRRRVSSNLLVVIAALAAALVLTTVRRAPESLVPFEFETPVVRAAPGEKTVVKHDLTALRIFNLTLVRVKERYVDPSRIDPKEMLYQALDSVQFNIPEVLVEPYRDRNEVAVVVADKRQVFATDDVDSPWRLAAKLKKVFRFIEANMNHGADLASVEYAAVNGMLNTLDPHSVLMDPEAAKEMDVSTSGKFGGLGIVIRMIDRKLTVVRPMKNTPAWKSGVKAGDHIVKINDEMTENLTTNEAVDRMRGEPKTGVTLWIERKGTTGVQRYDIVRDFIHVESVDHKMLDKNVGLIRIKQFSSSTTSEVGEAMEDLYFQGAKAWVLDLRWNPGGLLEQAVRVADLFVDAGTIVTTVSGRDRDPRRSGRGPGDVESPVAVLVNGSSASASEIVAGALKNLDRAVIIGGRTFGKGSVQELYDNDDGSKLKLTVAQYLTPGDRSIQSLGIVPDIQLQRMFVPGENKVPSDVVRLLPPSHSYGEKDLDAHLTSTYAKDTDKPSHELAFLLDQKPAAQPASGDDPEEAHAVEEEPADDELKEDFEIKLARDLVAGAGKASRSGLIRAAGPVLAKRRAEEEKRLGDALGKLGVDWAAPPADKAAPAAKLTATMTVSPGRELRAGDIAQLTGTVKNDGPGTAYRTHVRVNSDDPVFEDAELVFGKIGPGETKTFTTRIQIPKDALDRVEHLEFEVREARNTSARVAPLAINVTAAPRPTFAHAYQLIDDGNGDGLLQKGEHFRVKVTIKNSGAGVAPEATAMLRNATGDGVLLDKSRFELGAIAPGESRDLEFGFDVTKALRKDDVTIELLAYDAVLSTQASEKIVRTIHPAVKLTPASGTVEAKGELPIYEAAGADAPVLGWTQRGARFKVLGNANGWTKIEVASGRPGFVTSSQVGRANGAVAGTAKLRWQSTPPAVAVKTPTLETRSASYVLSGAVTDDTQVEDLQIFVSSRAAKVDGRKVFYLSNKSGAKKGRLDFSAEVPLWPGSNRITVVARESTEVRSMHTFYVYRDSAQTAAAPAP